jgi:hypothetical protein
LALAGYYLELESLQDAMDVLDQIDLPSADVQQRIQALQAKAEVYRLKGKYGYAIDQYINIEVMPGLSPAEKVAAADKIQQLQDEAQQKQLEKQQSQLEN